MTVSAFEGVDKKAKPERSLVESLKKNSGRNSYGRITVRHQGGGNRKQVQNHRLQARQDGYARNGAASSNTIPTAARSSPLLKYEDGELRYILAPVGLKAGDTVISSAAARISSPATACPSPTSPLVRVIHNIELNPGTRRTARPLRRRCCSAYGEGRQRWRRCVCPPAKSAMIRHELHGYASVRSATSITATFTSVRRVGSVIWASVLRSAALS